MGLDFGLLADDKNLKTADYKSADSNQNESLHYGAVSGDTDWHELYTVPADKTFYVSGIMILTNVNGTSCYLGTGAAASEIEFLVVNPTQEDSWRIALTTPIKFAGGTRISFKVNQQVGKFSIVGWEE
jgi:hypothetical protein